MDFLLKNEEISIEVKMTRDGLKDKELGEQLIIDIAKRHYKIFCVNEKYGIQKSLVFFYF